MLRRGQKIEVIEYYGKGNMRPKVGDIGYISNMFLYPKHKFILADAMFYKYGDGDTRMEHKRFFIDAGMDKSLKVKFVKIGVRKSFFVDNFHINLNPVVYMENYRHSRFNNTSLGFERSKAVGDLFVYSQNGWNTNNVYPKVIGSFGIWNKLTTARGKEAHKSKVKLPCVKVKPFLDNPKTIVNSKNLNELRSWFVAAVAPILFLFSSPFIRSCYIGPSRVTDGNIFSVADTAFSVLNSIMSERMVSNDDGIFTLDLGKDLFSTLKDYTIVEIAILFKQLLSYNKMFVDRLDKDCVKKMIEGGAAYSFLQNLEHIEKENSTSLWEIPIEKIQNPILYEHIASLYFRAIMGSAKPKSVMPLLDYIKFPASNTNIKSINSYKTLVSLDNDKLKIALQ